MVDSINPHMRFPTLIRGSLIGKADASDALALKNGEIGPLGDLAQLVVMIEDRSCDHGCEGRIRILCPIYLECCQTDIPGTHTRIRINGL